MKHGWKYKKIKDVCTKGSSNLQQNKIVELNGDYPVFGASGFVQNIDTYQQERPYIGIVKDGSGVGRVNTYPAKSSLLGTMQYIIPNNNINLGYVAYCLQSLKLSKFASGAAIPHIYFRDYGETYIPVPPLPVQEDICSLLYKLNRVIEAKKEQLKELDNLAQSLFYDMFGDPAVNEKGWEIKKIEEVATLNKGITYSPDEVVSEGGTIVLRSGNIQGNMFDLEDIVRIRKKINPSKYVHENEILMCNRNGSPRLVGKVAKIPKLQESMTFGTFMTVVISDMYEYLFAFFQTEAFREQIKFTTAIAINQISLPLLASVKLPIPPLPLQQAFAEKVKAIEQQKELINQSIKDVQTLFDAKMDYYFGD